jgi:hypothetical protein
VAAEGFAGLLETKTAATTVYTVVATTMTAGAATRG